MGSAGKTVEVGSVSANTFRLHDMHGNVAEWCEDAWLQDYVWLRVSGYQPTAPHVGRR
jgi:formylglycine-generating enzyme required for sulfatase activity